MPDDAPALTVEECLMAIAVLSEEVTRLRALVSTGYARKRPAIVDVTPIKRTEDVP